MGECGGVCDDGDVWMYGDVCGRDVESAASNFIFTEFNVIYVVVIIVVMFLLFDYVLLFDVCLVWWD